MSNSAARHVCSTRGTNRVLARHYRMLSPNPVIHLESNMQTRRVTPSMCRDLQGWTFQAKTRSSQGCCVPQGRSGLLVSLPGQSANLPTNLVEKVVEDCRGCGLQPRMNREPLQNLRMVVVGTGSMGMKHMAILAGMDRANPIAVPKHIERINELTQNNWPVAKDVAEAVRMGATLGIIATDTGQHVSDGITAIESGLDLLVEKPLGVNSLEAGQLCRRAQDAGRQLFVACDLRFSESMNLFRQLLPEIGDLHSVRVECQTYMPDWQPERPYLESYRARTNEGGVLLDLVHEIDYTCWSFGWPASLQARVRNLGRLGIAADEITDLSWEAPSGYLVSISLDYLSRPPRRQMRAFGESGTLEWDWISGTVTLKVTGLPDKQHKPSQTVDEMYLAQAQAFVNSHLGMCDPRLATGQDGVNALAVCDAARRSSDNGREEEVIYG